MNNFKTLLAVVVMCITSMATEAQKSLMYVTSDSASIIAPNNFFDKDLKRIYYAKSDVRNITNSILSYYDIPTKKSYEIARVKVNDAPQFIKATDQNITAFIPHSLTDFKLIEINTNTGEQQVQQLPEKFSSIYFSSFFRFYSNKKDIFAIAFNSPYLRIYKNNFEVPADSLKLDAWLLNTYFNAETGQLFCLEKNIKEKALQVEIIDITKANILSKNTITFFDKIKEAGLYELSGDTIAVWYKPQDYKTYFLTYEINRQAASIPILINAGLQSLIYAENTCYVNLAYHSGKFYEWTFGDLKDQTSTDSLKQYLSYAVQLDIISNLFKFNCFTDDEMINVLREMPTVKDKIEEPLLKRYPRITGSGEQTVEVDLENIGTQKGELQVFFQALSVKDRIQIIQEQNGEKKILYDTGEYVSDQANANIPLSSLTGTKVKFVITSQKKSSSWSIDYEIKSTQYKE